MARCHNIPALPTACDGPCPDQEDPCGPQAVTSTARGGTLGCSDLEVSLLQLGDQEGALFDCWAEEVVQISGTPIDYYSLDLTKSERDPLYDEPIQMVWRLPLRMRAHVTIDAPRTAEARDEGMTWEIRMGVWIPRGSFEALGAPRPKESDVLRVWDIPFFDRFGSGNDQISGQGYYFDVQQVQDDGHIFDGPHFTGFKLETKRTTTFDPERRVFGDGVARVV